jgi:hypothetical protein
MGRAFAGHTPQEETGTDTEHDEAAGVVGRITPCLDQPENGINRQDHSGRTEDQLGKKKFIPEIDLYIVHLRPQHHEKDIPCHQEKNTCHNFHGSVLHLLGQAIARWGWVTGRFKAFHLFDQRNNRGKIPFDAHNGTPSLCNQAQYPLPVNGVPESLGP